MGLYCDGTNPIPIDKAFIFQFPRETVKQALAIGRKLGGCADEGHNIKVAPNFSARLIKWQRA